MSFSRSGPLLTYLASLAGLNLVWELLQMPFYTLWSTGTWGTMLYSALHCTVGDIFIAACALGAAWLILGRPAWPSVHFWRVAGLALVLGIGFTVFSEWRNVFVVRRWAYASEMPLVFGIGLMPLLQWLIVPLLAFLRVAAVHGRGR